MDNEERDVLIPEILRQGRRGSNVRIWTFLYLNDWRWFTAREIAEYLDLPLSTVQLSLRKINIIAPRIRCKDIQTDQRGRPEKQYRFQRLVNSM